MKKIKFVSVQRAEDIISTHNPKYKWFYNIKSSCNDILLIFWCEKYYRKYAVAFRNNDMAIQIMSYLTDFLKKNNFLKKI